MSYERANALLDDIRDTLILAALTEALTLLESHPAEDKAGRASREATYWAYKAKRSGDTRHRQIAHRVHGEAAAANLAAAAVHKKAGNTRREVEYRSRAERHSAHSKAHER